MKDITIIIEVVIYCIGIILSIAVIPLIKAKLGAAKVTEDKTALDVALMWIEIACEAAEEAARTGLIHKSNKYLYAVNLLEKRGITFDTKTTEALVNSTVWKLFNQFKEESEEQSLPGE